MKQTIFYSWQSDIAFNNQSIRDSLRAAITDMENIPGNPQFNLIDSTSNLIGSTHIPESILRDIAASDIFICDLTIVGKGISNDRMIPNPNVLIELGYALSQLTWYRTIVIFNEHFGEVKRDLPFDIEKRSVLTAMIRDKDDSNGRGLLKTKLKDWIQKIIYENPQKPSRVIHPFEASKRKEDAKVIRKIKTFFVIDGMDDFFEEGYIAFERDVAGYIEDFVDFTSSISFFVHDAELNRLITQLQLQFRKLDSLVDEYKMGTVRFTHRNKMGSDPNRFDRAKGYIREMEMAFTEFVHYARRNYPEVKFNTKRF